MIKRSKRHKSIITVNKIRELRNKTPQMTTPLSLASRKNNSPAGGRKYSKVDTGYTERIKLRSDRAMLWPHRFSCLRFALRGRGWQKTGASSPVVSPPLPRCSCAGGYNSNSVSSLSLKKKLNNITNTVPANSNIRCF